MDRPIAYNLAVIAVSFDMIKVGRKRESKDYSRAGYGKILNRNEKNFQVLSTEVKKREI